MVLLVTGESVEELKPDMSIQELRLRFEDLGV